MRQISARDYLVRNKVAAAGRRRGAGGLCRDRASLSARCCGGRDARGCPCFLGARGSLDRDGGGAEITAESPAAADPRAARTQCPDSDPDCATRIDFRLGSTK